MARSQAGRTIYFDYSPMAVTNEVPVEPCLGWTNECAFCEERLGKWEELNDDVTAKVLTKPGIFEIALKNQDAIKVVDIGIDIWNAKEVLCYLICKCMRIISAKKSKLTNSVILIRWMNFSGEQEKEAVKLCAHWFNNGVLPKFTRQWPGMDILELADAVEFSVHLKKWCYPKPGANSKKCRGHPIKVLEEVAGCVLKQPCETCDDYFGEWHNMDDVVSKGLAPSSKGIYMIATQCKGNTVPFSVIHDAANVSLIINQSLDNTHKCLRYLDKCNGCLPENVSYVVRWLEMRDVSTNNFCYLFAHWLNSEVALRVFDKTPGEQQLYRNKFFVLRSCGKKWCCEMGIYKYLKRNKRINPKKPD